MGLLTMGYTAEQTTNGLMHAVTALGLVGYPHEGDVQSLQAYLLVEAVGLAYLPLGAIAVHSMVQAALGHTDQHLHTGNYCIGTLQAAPYTTNRPGGSCTVGPFVESIDVALEAEVLSLGETLEGCHLVEGGCEAQL